MQDKYDTQSGIKFPHNKKEACPAFDKQCLICRKKGYFTRQCCLSKALYVEEENSDDEEAFFIKAVRSPASQLALVTRAVNDYPFEIDAGVSCNTLPLADYIKVTGNKKMCADRPNQNLPHHVQ